MLSPAPRRPWAALAVALCLIAPACSIAVDEAAREIPDPPSDLFATTTAPTVPVEPEPDFTLDLYFLNEANQLVVVERSRDTPATPEEAVNALLANPTAEEMAERELGTLTSKLVSSVYTAEPAPDPNGLLRVTAGEELRATSENEPALVILIFQQIVCTLTDMDLDITTVQIQDATGPIPVSVANAPVERPVGRSDFGDCATAEPPPESTTSTRPTTTSTRRFPQPTSTVTTVASTPPTT